MSDFNKDVASCLKFANKPTITYEIGSIHTAVEQSMPALAECGEVFQRAHKLVMVEKWDLDHQKVSRIHRPNGSPVIHEISYGTLQALLSKHAYWERYYGKVSKPINPPSEVVGAIYKYGLWKNIPYLVGVTPNPIFRPDGSIIMVPGFDDETGLIYLPPPGETPTVPEKPTKDEAIAALNMLLDVICDFPFASDAGRVAWVSAILSRVAYPAFEGTAPFYLFSGTTAGTGKTLLVKAFSLISTGSVAATSPAIGDNEEVRKCITAHLASGDQVVLFDNLESGSTLGCEALNSVLTSEIYQCRTLGKSEAPTYPNATIWCGTGNNIQVRGDMCRRTLVIGLESLEEHPERRPLTQFKYKNLLNYVKANRIALLSAALTIVRAYIVAGKPDQNIGSLGSFEGWSDTVRSTLVWLGMPDPILCLASENETIDPELEYLKTIATEWPKLVDAGNKGLTWRQVLGQIDQDIRDYPSDERKLTDLADALIQLCQTRDDRLPSPKQINNSINKFVNKVISIEKHRVRLRKVSGHASTCLWFFEILEPNLGGFGGFEKGSGGFGNHQTKPNENNATSSQGGLGGFVSPHSTIKSNNMYIPLTPRGEETNPPNPPNPPNEKDWADEVIDEDEEIPF